MRIAEVILNYLKEHNVDYIFGVPAGNVSPLYDAMNDVNIKPIITKNEAGAAYMAARNASVSRKLSVCIAAGAVGANNMVNGIADAMRAKAPVLIITGYVHRWQIGKGALQELNNEEILKPITKYSKTVLDENEVLNEIAKAVKIANTVPMGPVHIQIPIDIQMIEWKGTIPDKIDLSTNKTHLDKELMKLVCNTIEGEEHGLILVGKGCRGMSDEVLELSKHLQWPIITSPEGKGIIPSEYHLNLGNYGFSSSDASVDYVKSKEVTCIIVLGSSLGETSSSNFSSALFEGKKSIHVDWDSHELGKVYETDYKICADIKDVVEYIKTNTNKKEEYHLPYDKVNSIESPAHTGLGIRKFLEILPEYMPKDTYYVSDLGEFMNFIFKFLDIPAEGDFEINVNYAAMGSGIAGGVGVKLAVKDRPVAVFSGDGGFFMNGNEILTAKEYGLPIIYFIINNAMLGFVEHGHQFLFNRVVPGFKQERINISEMMKACGVKSMQISKLEEIAKIPEFIANLEGPAVIELVTDGSELAPNADRLKALQKRD